MIDRITEWLLGLNPDQLIGQDWRLGLAGEMDNYLRLGLIALAIGLVMLVIFNYRREGSGRRRMRTALASLRIAAILLILCLLLQPAIIIRIRHTLHSTVVVLLDDSRSMSYADPYTGPSEPIGEALVKATGLDRQALAATSRSELMRRQLLSPASPIAALRRDHPVEVLAFAPGENTNQPYTRLLASLDLLDANPATQPTTRPADLARQLETLAASGSQTDLPAAMRNAVDRYRGRRIAAIILLSDGQPTTDDTDDRLAAAAAYAGGVERYAVMVGDPTPPKNLLVVSLRLPREIRSDSSTTAQVNLAHRNLTGQQASLAIYRRAASQRWPDDLSQAEPLAEATVELIGADDSANATVTQQASIELPPAEGELGEYVYRIVARTGQPERTIADNAADALVRLSDRTIRVLLISGDAGWEFRYLRNFLLRQPELFSVSIWQQNADPEVNQGGSTGMKLTRLPRSLKELIDTGTATQPASTQPTTQPTLPPGYDVVILYDPLPTKQGFDETFLKLLYQYVTQHRGGLCYIASNKYTWDVLSDPAAAKLRDLLPVVIERNEVDVTRIIQETRPQAWPVQLTEYGVGHPVTNLTGAGQSNATLWPVLPGAYWAQAVAYTKPAARILAVSSDPARRTGRDRAPEPVLAAQTVGTGRVLYVGFDETWRWRFLEEGFYHRRFWTNVIRYLAPSSARQVILTTGGDRFDLGQRITIEAEAYDKDFRPLTQPTLTVNLTQTETGQARAVELPAIEARPGRYRTTMLAEHTGSYELTVGPRIAPPSRVAGKQIVIALPQAEARRTEASPATLRQFATSPENVLNLSDLPTLAERIGPATLTAVEQRQHTLWDTPAALGLLVILLGVEWALRKKSHMA
jgi:hypothetical protein